MEFKVSDHSHKSTMAMWYYVSSSKGKKKGPVTAEGVASLLVEEKMDPSTLVWTEGMAKWKKLKKSSLWHELVSLTACDEEEEEGGDDEEEYEQEEEDYEQEGPPVPRVKVRSNPRPNVLLHSTGSLQDELADPRDVFVSKVVFVDDEEGGWATALVVAHDGHGVMICERLDDKRRVKVDGAEKLMLCNDEVAVADLTTLDHISEPALLYNLGARYILGETYTSMGVALVSINPCSPSVGTEASFEDYALRRRTLKNAPHPWATAQLAYDLMCFSNCNQAILVSGDSGSGKTHVCSTVLDYLIRRGCDDDNDDDMEENGFERRLQICSVILDAFGHAKTQSAPSSSRFASLLRLYYNEEAKLYSAFLDTFLLERGRVLRLGEHERSFNIFYQLLAGKDSRRHPALASELSRLVPGAAKDYELLAQSDCFAFDGCCDEESFDALVDALGVVGFTDQQISGLFSVACAVLNLGNVSFDVIESGGEGEGEGGGEAVVSAGVAERSLHAASNALQVSTEDLRNLLTHRRLRRKGVECTVALTPLDAACARDWVVSSLYNGLFESLCHYINTALDNGRSEMVPEDEQETFVLGSGKFARAAALNDDLLSAHSDTFIALVDSTGFGPHELSDLDHFLAAYAAEALESTFRVQVLQTEPALFRDQGLDFEDIEGLEGETCSSSPLSSSYTACVDLISARGTSILSALDCVCRMPQPRDEDFLAKIHSDEAISLHPSFLAGAQGRQRQTSFTVRHFGGDVQYSCFPSEVETAMGIKGSAWVGRNNDVTPQGLLRLCQCSAIAEVRDLPIHATPDVTKMSHNLSTTFKPTMASVATKTINDLTALLMSITCLYVRCLVPNVDMAPAFFDNAAVCEKMRRLRIVESCRVFKAGFSVRITFDQVRESLGEGGVRDRGKDRDRDDLNATLKLFRQESPRLLVACVLAAYGVAGDAYKLGKDVVFFREDQLEAFDAVVSGPGETAKERAALAKKLRALLERARAAYELADALDNECEDLDHTLGQVESAAKAMTERFGAVELSPHSLKGRIKVVSSQVASSNAVVSKLRRMYDTAAESAAMCRVAADQCDLEVASSANQVVGELFDQIIHQIRGVLGFIESVQESLDLAENDIGDVERLSQARAKVVRDQLRFKVDQAGSMGEALVDMEREKSRAEDTRLRETQGQLEARLAAEREAARLLTEAKQRELEAEESIAALQAQSAARIKAARSEADRREWAHAEAKADLEGRMRRMEEAHERRMKTVP